jgi:protein-disulfide isomerase
MASLAAGLQGKFWEFHDRLFENMKALDDARVQQIARELSLDLDSFTRDIKKQSLQDLISRDVVEGNRAQVEGTPTVFINGKKLLNQTVQGFQIGIDEILSKTRK